MEKMQVGRMMVLLVQLGVFTTGIHSSATASNTVVESGRTEKLILKSLNVHLNLVQNLEHGMKGLSIVGELTKFIKTVIELDVEMNSHQRRTLSAIFKVNEGSALAMNKARLVVTKLRNLSDDLLFILNGDGDQTDEDLKLAVEVYVEESKLMEKNVQGALERLEDAAMKMSRAEEEIVNLKGWLNETRTNISGMSDKEFAVATLKANGNPDAAKCMNSGPFAIIICPLTIGMTYSAALENYKVKNFEEKFDKGMEQLDKMSEKMAEFGQKTKALVDGLESDIRKLDSALSILDQRKRHLTFGQNSFPKTLQESVRALYDACRRYKSNSFN